MIRKIIIILIFTGLLFSTVYSQVGIRAGVNIADQNFQGLPDNVEVSELTAFHVGGVYQLIPDLLLLRWLDLGFETGAMFSQKGSMFSLSKANQFGYNELNYIEVPLNLHIRFKLGKFGLYAYGGMFAACLVSAKTIYEEVGGAEEKWEFGYFKNRMDYGYSAGGGIDILRKLQIGFNYSHSLKKLLPVQYVNERMHTITSIYNKMYSVNVTFLF